MRFGSFRETLEGKIEERLPGMFIKIPDEFASQNPQFVQNLRTNQNRLTTPFDLHATLLHAIQYPDTPKFSEHQRSLFQPISPHRTCSEAIIADHWCTCQFGKIVDINPMILAGTRMLVEELNRRLEEHGEDKCSKIELDSVIRAEMFEFDPSMVGFTSSADEDGRIATIKSNNLKVSKKYQVQFKIIPGGGLLEGGFTVSGKEKIEIGMHFSRVNSYGVLPCQPKPLIREFCSCKTSYNHL